MQVADRVLRDVIAVAFRPFVLFVFPLAVLLLVLLILVILRFAPVQNRFLQFRFLFGELFVSMADLETINTQKLDTTQTSKQQRKPHLGLQRRLDKLPERELGSLADRGRRQLVQVELLQLVHRQLQGFYHSVVVVPERLVQRRLQELGDLVHVLHAQQLHLVDLEDGVGHGGEHALPKQHVDVPHAQAQAERYLWREGGVIMIN